MQALIFTALISTIGSMEMGPWFAAECFTNARTSYPRYYFSPCMNETDFDYEKWCRPYDTRFSMKSVSKSTHDRCRKSVEEFKATAKPEALVCDFGDRGVYLECYEMRLNQ